ncbi:MAG: ATP-binding cassette domain-containing protein [Candidatus Dormibacteraeota bacterium]|nr:ATP-binding cassette domain-containing protein [Candidatus Dormibacteraeota bacterium]
MSEAAPAVFEVDGAIRRYRLARTSLFGPRRSLAAVAGVSFAVRAGESLGVVGESGSGKSTLMRLLLGLERPDAGRVEYCGGSLQREVQVVFQDPAGALDPRMRVGEIVLEPLRVMRLPGDRAGRLAELLEAVGLPETAARLYPHQFSGGQRQRIAIARALAPRPQVLLADEPVSALDVSVRAQILNLLQDLREAYGLTLVLVSHDLAVVRHLCDRVLVMRRGEIVEAGETRQIFRAPQHEYTRLLLASIPTLKPRRLT